MTFLAPRLQIAETYIPSPSGHVHRLGYSLISSEGVELGFYDTRLQAEAVMSRHAGNEAIQRALS